MSNRVYMKLTGYHRFSSGQTCLIGVTEPKNHKLMTSNCTAKIIIDDTAVIPLRIVGQDINARNATIPENDQTFLRIHDELGELLSDFKTKKMVVVVDYPV